MKSIDLGLSVKWATCNIGASKPEEYGNYYAWGETTPKDCYNWNTYKYGSDDELTKYCSMASRGQDCFTDTKTVLDHEDDAVCAAWGGSWRLPTDAEWQELIDNCTWKWKALNGVNGYEVKGTNGNSIFLPAVGFRDDDDLRQSGRFGFYWSSSLYTDYPLSSWIVYFQSNNVLRGYSSRYYGQSVRPVLSNN